MNPAILKKVWPHLAAYLIMMAVTFAFFAPAVFSGKVLSQSDNARSREMQTELQKIHTETGQWPQWTNSMFSGMPTAQIYLPQEGNFVKSLFYASLLGAPITSPHMGALLAMACLYLLLIVLGVDWRIALLGSVSFGLSTYMLDLNEGGHTTKLLAIALTPGVFAGAILTMRGQYLLGGGLAAAFTAIHVYANHLQITYYTFFFLALLGLFALAWAAMSGEWKRFGIAAATLALAATVGVGTNATRLFITKEYAEETIRGQSELTEKAEKGNGLDKEYAWQWSVGIGESMSLLVPHAKGGGGGEQPEVNDDLQRAAQAFAGFYVNQGASQEQAINAASQQLPSLIYFGEQPFVGTAIYAGAIVIFLALLGLLLSRERLRWWLLAVTLISLSFAWGKHFFLNDILFDNLPGFNKFRAVSMALGFTQVGLSLLACLGLKAIFDGGVGVGQKQKMLLISAGTLAAVCLLAAFGVFSSGFSGLNDTRLPAEVLEPLKTYRAGLVKSDAMRSLFFILAAAAVLFVYLRGWVKSLIALILVGLLCTADIWTVGRRTLFHEKFQDRQTLADEIKPTEADQQVMADKDPHFRVLDMSRGNPFTNAMASKFHKNIGGYHAAKLAIYQDLIEKYLSEPGKNLRLIGMLNGKYILQEKGGGQITVFRNPEVLGNAWFVKNYMLVENADAELNGLADLNPRDTALIQKKFEGYMKGLSLAPDSTANIRLTSYHPDKLVYEYSATTEQLAVFSEVYYPPAKGWKVFLNGKEVEPFVKANYVLRALRLPAGQKQVLEMRFASESYSRGVSLAIIGSIITWLFLIGGIVWFFRKGALPDISSLSEVEVEKQPVKKPVATKTGKPKK